MNKKLLINFLIIGFILFLINKISKKSIKNIFSDYFGKIKNVFSVILYDKNYDNNKNQQKINKPEINLNTSLKKNNSNSKEELKKIVKKEPVKTLTKEQLLFNKVNEIINTKITKFEVPLNVSIPKKCNNNDITDIKKFINNQYELNNLKINNEIDYFYNNNLFEIKPVNISCYIYNNRNLICEAELELSLIFEQTDDDNIFSSQYKFNNKQGNYLINDFKILNIREADIQKNNLKLESFDTNSMDSLIPDNAFSSEYEKDSSNYTTESIINFDTA